MSARSLFARLGLAFGLAGGLHGGAVAAQSVTLDKAPPAWVAYAKAATASISGWLNADTSAASHMREAMTKLHPQTEQLPPVILSLWVATNGTVSKVEAPSSGNAQADGDLRALLLSKKLDAPPKGMLLPMKLAIRLTEPKPNESPAK